MDLRHDVLLVRQEAATGEVGSPLRYAARDALLQYRDVASRSFAAMVGQDSTLNAPIWQQIGSLAFALDKAIAEPLILSLVRQVVSASCCKMP